MPRSILLGLLLPRLRISKSKVNSKTVKTCSYGGGRLSLSGLLNALDGVGAQEGRILFATTNKYSALDPALCRPGRMDLHIEFRNASKYQAHELFSRFYLPTEASSLEDIDEKESVDSGYSSSDTLSEKDGINHGGASPKLPLLAFTGDTHIGRAPKLSHDHIAKLAERFANAIPERECSMASLQGYLMAYKTRPIEAADDAGVWVSKERAAEVKEKEKKAKGEVKAITAHADGPVSEVATLPLPAGPLAAQGCTCGAAGVVGSSPAPKLVLDQSAKAM